MNAAEEELLEAALTNVQQLLVQARAEVEALFKAGNTMMGIFARDRLNQLTYAKSALERTRR